MIIMIIICYYLRMQIIFQFFHCYLITWHQHEEPLLSSLPTFNISKHFERKNFVILGLFTCNFSVAFRPKALTQTQGFSNPGVLKLILQTPVPHPILQGLVPAEKPLIFPETELLPAAAQSKPPAISCGNVSIA